MGFVPGGQPGIELIVTLNSGTFGTEISWNITDQNGNIVASGNGYQSNQVYNITECVPAGNYDFNMFDSFSKLLFACNALLVHFMFSLHLMRCWFVVCVFCSW